MIPGERREYPARPQSVNLVYFAVFDDTMSKLLQQGMGRTLNISTGGILLETYDRIFDSGKILITLGLKDDMVEVSADVVHSSNGENNTYNTGLSFDIADQDILLKLKKYIKIFHELEEK